MAHYKIPVIIHGITGRMGQIALKALQQIQKTGSVKVDGDVIEPIPIGLGRNELKVAQVSRMHDLKDFFSDMEKALEFARSINPEKQIYHNTLATGIRKEAVLQVLPRLDPKTTAVFMEKPLAPNYADGFAIVDTLEKKGFYNGVVHHMLATPGVRQALTMIPQIKPLSATMAFGYEVGSGFSGNKEFSGQRPDFNWKLNTAGGGIILDMCHEAYLSEALLGETASLSAVARLLVPRRLSIDGQTVIDCNVEDYALLRRQHVNGIVNTSLWTWFRRVNSEFGPLEIAIEGEKGSLIFGLYGLKVQWQESAPANRWERSVTGQKIEWRNYWQYFDLAYEDPFAFELAEFLTGYLTGRAYLKNAIHAVNILGEVEAQYESAAENGKEIRRETFFRYPQSVPEKWKAQRLQGKLKSFEKENELMED